MRDATDNPRWYFNRLDSGALLVHALVFPATRKIRCLSTLPPRFTSNDGLVRDLVYRDCDRLFILFDNYSFFFFPTFFSRRYSTVKFETWTGWRGRTIKVEKSGRRIEIKQTTLISFVGGELFL